MCAKGKRYSQCDLELKFRHSIHETEIQPLIPDIFRTFEILSSFCWGHRGPHFLPSSVQATIEEEGEEIEDEICCTDPDQNSVPSLVERPIVCPINIRGNDGASLHGDIIHAGRDCSCSNAVRVGGRPGNLNRMHIWETNN